MSRILIVDSNPRDMKRYQAFLSEAGHEVVLCQEGEEAAGAVGGQGGPFDLAVVLWELAGEPAGTELVTGLRRGQPDLPVIFVSESLDLTRAATAKKIGAQDFLIKPLERERFLAALDGAMRPKETSSLLEELQETIKGRSAALLKALEALARVISESENNVLLVGESGTGKELFAKAVHDVGGRAANPWVPVNVAAIPTTLLESQLFGHEKGAFTDARERHRGCFEEVGEGVLFLDEIGELRASLQAKLLRVIECKPFRRVGGSEDISFRGRLVCATNRDLIRDVSAGRFREALYYRIATHEIRIPPLRERGDDLWLLAREILDQRADGRRVRLARESRAILSEYPFPGNVRELEDILQHALLECSGEDILPYHLPLESMKERDAGWAAPGNLGTVEWPEHLFRMKQPEAMREIERAFNRQYLPRGLQEAGGNVSKATKKAGWKDDKTFRTKWRRAGLDPLSNRE